MKEKARHAADFDLLTFGGAARLHPFVRPAEQRRVVVDDVFVAHEGLEQLVRNGRHVAIYPIKTISLV
jgi:hypothetical protein